MTEPTIDLSKDLELWCDFAPRYYDSQRNRIQDKSGYGRHPEASGGPTFGVEGPDSFKSVSFDGTDDTITFDNAPDIVGDGTVPFTLFARVNVASDTAERADAIRINDSGYSAIEIRDEGEIGFTYDPDGSGVYSRGPNISISFGQYYPAIARWDGTNITLFVGDKVLETDISIEGDGVPKFVIGDYSNDDTKILSGELAQVAVWSRAISDAEVEELKRLTAPRRAML